MVKLHLQKQLGSGGSEISVDVDLVLNGGEIVALYGSSGAGKTSVLRMVAGSLKPDDGFLVVGGETWYDATNKIFVPAWKRSIGMVFQDYALFPNMTVRENIAYAGGATYSSDIPDILDATELADIQDKKTGQLSGGQRQRVALARAMIRRPQVLLLDEPFTALDTALRLKMHELVLRLHRQFQCVTILVTHDLLDVARLAGRVFLLKEGRIEKSGEFHEVIDRDHVNAIVKAVDEKYD